MKTKNLIAQIKQNIELEPITLLNLIYNTLYKDFDEINTIEDIKERNDFIKPTPSNIKVGDIISYTVFGNVKYVLYAGRNRFDNYYNLLTGEITYYIPSTAKNKTIYRYKDNFQYINCKLTPDQYITLQELISKGYTMDDILQNMKHQILLREN